MAHPAVRAGWLALMLSSGVLVTLGCEEEGVKPTATVQAADTADQVLTGMQHYLTEEGIRRSLVEADTAYLYEGTQIAELRHVKVTFFDNSGVKTSEVTADSGTYYMRDGSMKARGHVVATTPDGRRLTSSTLNYDTGKREIWSDQPFTYDRPGQHLEGNAFRSDPEFRTVVTEQPRGGQLPGQGGDSARKGVVLPGQ